MVAWLPVLGRNIMVGGVCGRGPFHLIVEGNREEPGAKTKYKLQRHAPPVTYFLQLGPTS
jgi:hypothetical protein